MKFGKRLASQVEETLPEWKDKYLSYKQLKKRLKLMSAPECFTEAAFDSPIREGESAAVDAAVDELKKLTKGGTVMKQDSMDKKMSAAAAAVSEEDESEFTRLLEVELEKFNSFFIEKEEEYVIRLQELKNRIEQHKSSPEPDEVEMVEVRRDFVTFHGEMVLLFNYSSLNYTGLVKILKKYDKRTGTCLRSPFIQRVLKQPFFTTELLSKLVEECEQNLRSIFPADDTEKVSSDPEKNHSSEKQQPEQEQVKDCEQVEGIYRSTLAALQTLKDLRKGSSTYTALSLPPFETDHEQ